MTGFLLLDKPAGLTSHDVVNRIRRLTGERRVGHAGTLDPFATGLLIVGVGRESTREFPKLVGLDKTYQATFVLGATSDTDDLTGATIPLSENRLSTLRALTLSRVQEALQKFVGPIEQIPPTYSAIKIGGKKMYEAARAGKPLEAKPRPVIIYSIEQIALAENSLSDKTRVVTLVIHCSSGTYIRAIARDLGQALGVGGYVSTLRRTHIGPFTIEESTSIDTPHLIAINTFLSRL
ncbi:tRNA pseudouridine(55) synthase TruB [Candidatus Uhrbacteria bacterium]|nr:tRNA pseudouridine(55) synthase TruB [Candidatus Uhrbacteria bacterium]